MEPQSSLSKFDDMHPTHLLTRMTGQEPTIIAEKKLLFALVERALLDLSDPRNDVREGSLAWVRSEDKTPFSFYWSAEALGLGDFQIERCRQLSIAHVAGVAKKIVSDVECYQRTRKAHCGRGRYNHLLMEA